MKLFIFLCLLLLIVPVVAQTVSYNAPEGKAVYYLWFDAPPNSDGTFSVTLGNGTTLSGSWVYTTGLLTSDLTVNFDGETDQEWYILHNAARITIGMSAADRKNISVRADSLSIDVPGGAPIVGYTLSSGQDVPIDHILMDYTTAGGYVTGKDEDWISRMWGYVDAFWYIFSGAMYWGKFLFIDNGVMILSLYIIGTAAVAINQSKSIFAFYKTWFRQQRAIFEFVIGIFSVIMSIMAQVFQALKII